MPYNSSQIRLLQGVKHGSIEAGDGKPSKEEAAKMLKHTTHEERSDASKGIEQMRKKHGLRKKR